MKISVIIPTLNRARTLGQAIDSVLRQTYKDIEVIVVDGLSSDGTVAVLESYGSRVQWISERDRNTSEALNKALRLATGEFVTVLCSDDRLKDDHVIANAVADLQAHPEVDLLCAEIEITPRESNAILYRWPSQTRGMLFGMSLHLPGAFFRRRLVSEKNFDESLAVASDYDLFLHITKVMRAKVMTVSRVNVVFRLGGLCNDVRRAFQVAEECFEIRSRYFGRGVAWAFFVPALSVAALRTAGIRPQHWLRETRLWLQGSK